jgi:hypothetical protein
MGCGSEHFAFANNEVTEEGIVTSKGIIRTDSREQGNGMSCAWGTPGIMR